MGKWAKEITSAVPEFFEGSIVSIIELLQGWLELGATEIEMTYDRYCDVSGIAYIAKRQETDEEYAARLESMRLEQEARDKAKAEAQKAKASKAEETRRKQFLKLKAEFEPQS